MISKTFIDVQKLKFIVVPLLSIGVLMTINAMEHSATLLYFCKKNWFCGFDLKGVSYN